MKIINLFIIIVFCLFNFSKLISLDYVLLKNIESFNKLILLEPIFSNNDFSYFSYTALNNKIVKTNIDFKILKQIDSIDFKYDTVNNIPIVRKIFPDKVLHNEKSGNYYLTNFSKSKYFYQETADGCIKTDPLTENSSVILYANFLTNGELILIKPDSIFFVGENVQSYEFNKEQRTQVLDYRNFLVNCEDTLYYLNKDQEIIRNIRGDYKIFPKLLFTFNPNTTFFSSFVAYQNCLYTTLYSASSREAKLIEMSNDSFTIEDLTTANKPAEKLEIPLIRRILLDNYGNLFVLISDMKNYGPISLWIRTNKIWKEILVNEIVKSDSLILMDKLYKIDNRILIPVNNAKKDSIFFLILDTKLLNVEESLENAMPSYYIENIYPNPFKNHTIIELSCTISALNKMKINLYNSLGVRMNNFDYNIVTYDSFTGKGLIRVNVNQNLNGFYFLIFDDDKQIKSKSIIIGKPE